MALTSNIYAFDFVEVCMCEEIWTAGKCFLGSSSLNPLVTYKTTGHWGSKSWLSHWTSCIVQSNVTWLGVLTVSSRIPFKWRKSNSSCGFLDTMLIPNPAFKSIVNCNSLQSRQVLTSENMPPGEVREFHCFSTIELIWLFFCKWKSSLLKLY